MLRLVLLVVSLFISQGECDLVYYMDQMCGGTLNMNTPTNENWRVALDLTSKSTYNEYMRCSLNVVTKPTRKLKFHFTQFYIPDRDDYLAVQEGDIYSQFVSGINGRLSLGASVLGKTFTTYDNRMSLYFLSDGYTGSVGFKMIIESIDAGKNGTGKFDLHCGETFDLDALNMDSYFMRSSSDGKSRYRPDLNCSIIFKTRLSDNLKVQILKSSIEECQSCSCDRLELRDGSFADSPYVSGIDGRVCGYWNKTNTVFKTVGNSLFALFYSDHGDELTGFDLLITTERNDGMLKGAITVGCDSSNWNINLDMPQLHKLYPGLKTSDIYFGENRCSGTETLNDLQFHYGLDECLTNQNDLNGVGKYTNEVISVERNPQFSFLISRYVWRIAVECDITADNSSVGGFKDEIILGQAAYGQQQNMNVSYYLTSNFETAVSGNPLKATAGASIYLKVFATNINDWTVKMRLKSCYLEPSLDTADNMKYYIIKNGCETDANTHILSQLAHETRLTFSYFEYAGNQNGIYVVCEGIICKPSDTSLPCKQTCNPATARRVPVPKLK